MTQETHDHIEHGKQFDHVAEDCPECDGTGAIFLSCCGDDMSETESDKCLTCGDIFTRVYDWCEECGGTGEVQEED